MDYKLNCTGVSAEIYPCPTDFSGTDLSGNKIDYTNYYMRYNGKPYFAISGEMHFSRIDPAFWEDEIIKLKMAGITMVSTYLFWIHHEEIKGEFDWSGEKNLRGFLEICKRQDMPVILRIGPFSHGECRNGGFPDWMYGAPYDVRSNDPEYILYVKRYYAEIGKQAKGFMFKDGGPVVSIQLENEYEHASSPWEPSTESGGEWTNVGSQGRSHFELLYKLAADEGLITPLYSTTAWSGACAPEDIVMPLWGGYAYRPWIFYGEDIKEHPPTLEYIYRNFHGDKIPPNYTFTPEYSPRDYPFVCCEMGGGMACFYPYRFELPFESVEAMANVKAAGGCNFLGYYMYHGGTNPHGKRTPYLNECALPKMSYDYQAAIGEYGQLRESYHRCRSTHYFFKDFEEIFCDTVPVMPHGAEDIDPADTETLRYCARVNDGRGFLFINNFQDHAETKRHEDIVFDIEIGGESLRIPKNGSLSIGSGATAIMPINLDMDGGLLKYASSQLITRLDSSSGSCWFFKEIEGMKAEFCFDASTVSLNIIENCSAFSENSVIIVSVEDSSKDMIFSIKTADGHESTVALLTAAKARDFWRIKSPHGDTAVLSSDALLSGTEGLRLEITGKSQTALSVFPKRESIMADGKSYRDLSNGGIFSRFELSFERTAADISWTDASSKSDGENALKVPVVGSPVTTTRLTNARAVLSIPSEAFEGCKQLLIQVKYGGDIGHAYVDGLLINDNFANGAVWEFGLKKYREEVLEKGLYIYVSPLKKGSKVSSSSEMAARFVESEEEFAEIYDIKAVRVFDAVLEL